MLFRSFKTIVSAGLGVSTAIVGYFFSLDFWPVWGILMFLANYITYIGSIAIMVPIIAVAFLQFHSIWWACIFAIVLTVVRLIWIDYVEIRYSGRYMNVSPTLLLVSLAFFATVWGVVGMVLAVPLVTSLRIVLDHFPETKFLAGLMSGK